MDRRTGHIRGDGNSRHATVAQGTRLRSQQQPPLPLIQAGKYAGQLVCQYRLLHAITILQIRPHVKVIP